MKQETANALVDRINDGLINQINDIISQRLGLTVKFKTHLSHSWNTVQVSLEEDGRDTTEQLTATPLLREMFKDANLWCQVFYNEETENLSLCVHISYNHAHGGSNGLSLLDLSFDKNNIPIKL